MGLLVVPSKTSSLRQGDILAGVALFETSADSEAPVPADEFEWVLVLSRHCNAARKTTVVVAAITEHTPAWFTKLNEMGLDQVRQRLAALRDGDGTPDRFYLGSLPNRGPRRAYACLDLLYSVQVPTKTSARAAWVASRRIATLSDEHRRHLHVRLLIAFGREGFDDYANWSNGDLKLLIAAGERDLADAKKKHSDSVNDHEAAAANPSGKKQNLTKKMASISRQAEKATGQLRAAQQALAPYLAEWNRRHGHKDPLAS